MRRLALAAFLAVSCAHSSPPVTTFGNCTTDALRTASESILGDVTSALATGDYTTALANLATQFGSAEVGCAVDLIIAEFTTKSQLNGDAETNLVLQHAIAWRAAHPS